MDLNTPAYHKSVIFADYYFSRANLDTASNEGIDPLSAGIWATSYNLAQIDNMFLGVAKNFKEWQIITNTHGSGLNYSAELAKVGGVIKGIRIGGAFLGGAGIMYDGFKTFGANPTMSKGEFWTNTTFTAIGFLGLPGATVAGIYFAGEALIPGGWRALPMDSSLEMQIINNTSREGVWMSPYLFGK